jgi:thioredoxin
MKQTMSHVKHIHLCLAVCLSAALFLEFILVAQPMKEEEFQKQLSTGDEIRFRKISWQDALKTATENHKYIFMDAYASWCGPCKLLKRTTFRDKETAAFFNEHFINLTIDMEKGEGIDLAALWEIQAYPTMIIFDASGNPILKTIGFLEPRDLIEFGRHALEKKQEILSRSNEGFPVVIML